MGIETIIHKNTDKLTEKQETNKNKGGQLDKHFDRWSYDQIDILYRRRPAESGYREVCLSIGFLGVLSVQVQTGENVFSSENLQTHESLELTPKREGNRPKCLKFLTQSDSRTVQEMEIFFR